jgi:hypothetical protein
MESILVEKMAARPNPTAYWTTRRVHWRFEAKNGVFDSKHAENCSKTGENGLQCLPIS